MFELEPLLVEPKLVVRDRLEHEGLVRCTVNYRAEIAVPIGPGNLADLRLLLDTDVGLGRRRRAAGEDSIGRLGCVRVAQIGHDRFLDLDHLEHLHGHVFAAQGQRRAFE